MKDDLTSGRPTRFPSGRLNRLARFGGLATQVAGNVAMAGAKEWAHGRSPDFRSLVLTPRNIGRLADELAQMRGAAMKLGQLLSMDAGDVLPLELTNILARLRSDANFMPPKQLKKVLNDNWGPHWLRSFERFDVRPIAAASIGQVHRAKLRDGPTVAIKVQYPGVVRSIDSDVANVGALIRAARILPSSFDLSPYLEEAKRQLHEEIDYIREGCHMMAFRKRLRGQTEFHVPQVYSEWSTQSILSMSFADGVPIDSTDKLPQETRNQIVAHLVKLTLRELFEFGEMQTDPNFANYLFHSEKSQIVLLDFGAARFLDPEVVHLYSCVLRAGLANDHNALSRAIEAMGLTAPTTHTAHRERLLQMMMTGFDAMLENDSFDFGRTALFEKLQSDSLTLAEDGFLPPSLRMDVPYIQRKLGGLVLLATRLRAKVPIRSLLEPYLSDNGAFQRSRT